MYSKLSFTRLGLLLPLLAVACSDSSNVADPAPDDTGAPIDSATPADTQGDVTSETPTDTATSDTTAIDGAGDTSATDTTAADSSSPDATPEASVDSSADTGGTCSINALTGKSTGCSATEYCDAPSCTTGVCRPRPAATTDFAPACGCDKVTYWNATYAKSLGSSVGGSGACGTGKKSCGGIASIKCPSTTDSCVGDRGTAGTCGGADFGGVCWSIPSAATCLGTVGFTSYKVCGGSGPACQSYCEAVKSGHDFFLDSSCPT